MKSSPSYSKYKKWLGRYDFFSVKHRDNVRFGFWWVFAGSSSQRGGDEWKCLMTQTLVNITSSDLSRVDPLSVCRVSQCPQWRREDGKYFCSVKTFLEVLKLDIKSDKVPSLLLRALSSPLIHRNFMKEIFMWCVVLESLRLMFTQIVQSSYFRFFSFTPGFYFAPFCSSFFNALKSPRA